MTNTVWIKHPKTGGVAEVPKDALAMYRQSGWDLLPDETKAAMDQQAADAADKAERAMQRLAGIASGQISSEEPETKTTKKTTKESG